MPTIEDTLSDLSAEIAQLAGDVTAIGSASTTKSGLIKLSSESSPDDNSVPTVAFFKSRNILGSGGEAGAGLPQTQIDKINSLPPEEILAALSALPADLSSLAGRIIAVNSTGNGYELVVAPPGGGGSGSVTIIVDHFTGDGVTTAFTLSQSAANSAALAITVSGITIDPAIYNVSGTTLTFNDAPPVTNADAILVRHLAAEVTIGVPGDSTVTLAKMANGTPGKSLKYNSTTGVIEETDIIVPDNSISTVKLINKNVTLAKIADGTPGKILKFNDSTGVIEEVDVAALGSGATLIERQTILTPVSQVAFTAGINSTFKFYKLVCFYEISISTQMNLQVSSDGGTTYANSNYAQGSIRVDPQVSGSVEVINAGTSQNNINLNAGSAGDNGQIEILFSNPTSTTLDKFFKISTVSGVKQNNAKWFQGGASWRPSTPLAINGLCIWPGTGNITSGTFELYGFS